ncbi:hypothetical protein [Occallatibacter savannae]|uniref:hypothetical protein n=1 Tax=Occallatibacter savannae TaxID=1002691 RepID=UPI000D69C962|nr:hypothetical protein [Occallatibacter savannae]
MDPQQANQPPQYIEKSYPVTPVNQPPDSNAQMQMHQKHANRKHFDAANAERKRQIEHDTEELVRLARELNVAIERGNGPAPSEPALASQLIHKAEAIERLAHGVEEKMKLTVSGD